MEPDTLNQEVNEEELVTYLIVYNAVLQDGKNILKNNYISGGKITTPDDIINIINALQESEVVFDVKIINIIKIG
jgi:hypothetical protein